MSRWIRWSAFAVVVAVAATAGWVSYTHALDVIRRAGETGAVAFAYPTFIDGMVYMASVVLLAAARQKIPAPALAWWSLAAGITLTLACNVYSMASHGVLGGIAGALPAVALVLSYELLMWLIRNAPAAEAAAPERVPGDARARLNGHAERAQTAFAAELAAGTVPGIRRIKAELGVGSERAELVRDYLRELSTGT